MARSTCPGTSAWNCPEAVGESAKGRDFTTSFVTSIFSIKYSRVGLEKFVFENRTWTVTGCEARNSLGPLPAWWINISATTGRGTRRETLFFAPGLGEPLVPMIGEASQLAG